MSKFYVQYSTEELYQRIQSLCNSATDFDLDEQDYYVNEIRCIIDELDDRISNAICEQDE